METQQLDYAYNCSKCRSLLFIPFDVYKDFLLGKDTPELAWILDGVCPVCKNRCLLARGEIGGTVMPLYPTNFSFRWE